VEAIKMLSEREQQNNYVFSKDKNSLDFLNPISNQ